MELALFVYLAGIAGNLRDVLLFVCFVSFAVLCVYAIIIGVGCNEGMWKFSERLKSLRNAVISVFSLGIFTAAIPSEKTMYLMLAGYTTQQVVKSETADKVVKLINAKLDEYIIEINKEKK